MNGMVKSICSIERIMDSHSELTKVFNVKGKKNKNVIFFSNWRYTHVYYKHTRKKKHKNIEIQKDIFHFDSCC